jgi:adenylate cyclase
MRGFRRHAYWALCAAILAAALLIRLADPVVVQSLRLIVFDTFQRLAPRAYDPQLPVRVVDVDEASLAEIGQWPWPRTIMRDLVERLGEAGAAAIAFDVLFAEADRTSIEEVVKALPPEQASAILNAAPAARNNDAAFAEAIAKLPVVTSTTLTGRPSAPPPVKAGFAVAGDDPRPFIAVFAGSTSNLPAIDAAAAGIGSINWIPDRDQIVRRVALVYRVGDEFVPALAPEALRVALGASTYVLRASNASGETGLGQSTGLNAIRVGDREIPVEADGSLRIDFRHSEPGAFLSAAKVLSGSVPRDEIEGRIILIGSSAPGLLDLRATPLDTTIPGVEVHAQIIEHILAGRQFTRPDYASGAEVAIIFLLGTALAFYLPRASARISSALAIVIVIGLFGSAWLLYRQAGLLFDPLFPALALLLLTIAGTLYIYRQTEVQRAEVRRAFGRYVSPDVVADIIANPDRLELGGEVRELTLLFCDVRNFTSISERMNAQELTHFINSLLTPLSDVILQHRGTIDKFIGDAVMAFWNAPLDEPNHAASACRAAIEMAAAVEKLNGQWQAAQADKPFPKVRIGIGINTGECCVGNLGSEQRFDYSAIGDNVNIASRFEGLSKAYGVTTIVGERTATALPQTMTLELDLVRVKGRSEPTRIYTLLDVYHPADGTGERLRTAHGRFLTAYRAQEWDDAEAGIRECLESGIAGLESYYAVFRERIAGHRTTPLSIDWDGAHTAVDK